MRPSAALTGAGRPRPPGLESAHPGTAAHRIRPYCETIPPGAPSAKPGFIVSIPGFDDDVLKARYLQDFRDVTRADPAVSRLINARTSRLIILYPLGIHLVLLNRGEGLQAATVQNPTLVTYRLYFRHLRRCYQ
jgi:hypothetical protein